MIRGHSRSFKLVPFETLGVASYLPSIVTMTLSCFISEIKQNIAIPFGADKLEWWGYRMVKNFEDMFSNVHRIPACDRQTDRHLAMAFVLEF